MAPSPNALASMLVQIMGLAVQVAPELRDHPLFVEARELVQDAAHATKAEREGGEG